MQFTLPRLAAAVPFVLAAPLFAASAFATEPAQESTDMPAPTAAETPVDAETAPTAPEAPVEPAPAAEPVAAEEPEEEARICRNIRLDASSRRKSRVCLTQQGWRDLNNRR